MLQSQNILFDLNLLETNARLKKKPNKNQPSNNKTNKKRKNLQYVK